MADESGTTRSFDEIPSPFDDPLLKKAMENLRNIRKEAFGRPAASFMAGVSKATAGTAHILDVLATELSKKTGLSKGGIFKNIEDEYTRQYQRLKEQGVSEETALGKAQQVIYEGLGEAAVEVPKLVASGPAALPVWGAIGGASEAIEQGSSPLVGATTGAIQGAVLKGVLKGASKLPLGAREVIGGTTFGLPALLQELQKPPEERDYATVAGQTIVGGALMFRGKPELKGLRGGKLPGLTIEEVPEQPTIGPRKPGVEAEVSPAKQPWEMTGKDVGSIYHGGDKKISEVDFSKTQERDYGFYGKGFYGATKPEFTKGYGKSVSEVKLNPDAKILQASLKPEEAPTGLVDEIIKWEYNSKIEKVKQRGKEEAFRGELSDIKTDPLAWKSAVDEYARANNYNAVKYSDGEIVLFGKEAIIKPETPGERLTREAVAKTEPMPPKVEEIFKKHGLVPKGFSRGNGVYNYQDKSGSDGFIEAEGFSEKALADQIKRNTEREGQPPAKPPVPPTQATAEMPEPKPFGVPSVVKYEISRALKQKDIGDRYANKIMSYINGRGGLPKEKEMRDEYIRLADQTVKKTESWQAKTGKPRRIFGIQFGKHTENVIDPWSSMRYAMADVEAKTGVPGIYKNYHDFMDKSSIEDHDINKRFSSYFKNAGVDETKIDPAQEPFIKKVLFSSEDTERQGAWNNLTPESKKTTKLLNNMFQGRVATRLRHLLWFSWNHKATPLLKTLDELNAKPTKKENDIKRIGIIEDKLKDLMPPNATLSDMRDVDKIFATGGEQAVLDKLATVKWGTRKHYYMSEDDMTGFVDSFITSLVPGESIEKFRPTSARPATTPREAHTRKGKALMDQGALIPNVFNHVYRIEMMSAMISDITKFSDNFMRTNPTNEDIRLFKRTLKNALGYGEEASPAIKIVEGANRFFWRTYPLAITRGVPYAVRNLAQVVAFTPGQVNPIEGTRALGQIATGGLSAEFKQDFKQYYDSLISQKAPIYRHYMMLQQEQAATKGNRKAMKALDFFGKLVPLSDEASRVAVFPVAYKVAENGINDYRSGKIGYKGFLKRTRVSNFHAMQQMEILDLLKAGKDREAKFRIAENVTENVNFKYRAPERSGVEQTRAGRVIMGLYNWPRGMVEALNRNGIKPFFEGIEQKNWSKSFTALTGLVGTIGGGLLAKEILNHTIGKRGKYGEYDIGETLFGYGPGNVGYNIIIDVFDEAKRAHDYARAGKLDRAVDVLGNRAAYHLPLVNDFVNFYEAANDKQGVKAMSLLRGVIEGNMRKVGKNAKRESVLTWEHLMLGGQTGQHALFGTEESPSKSKGKSSTPITKEELLQRLRQAQRR